MVSIISNNCFSQFVHKAHGVGYETPFVDLLIHPQEFLTYLEYMGEIDLNRFKFISVDESNHPSWYDEGHYPLVKIDDCFEVAAIHYSSREEFKSKWKRRVPRLDFTNCLVKFSDECGATKCQLNHFIQFPHPNKLLILASNNKSIIPHCYDPYVSFPSHEIYIRNDNNLDIIYVDHERDYSVDVDSDLTSYHIYHKQWLNIEQIYG